MYFMLMLQNLCDCLLCLETTDVHWGGDKLMVMSIKNFRGCGFLVKMAMKSQSTLPVYKFIHKNFLQHRERV